MIDRIIEWSENCEILNQYWWVGIIFAVLIVVAWLITRWIRNWVV